MPHASSMEREGRSDALRAGLGRAWSILYNYGLLVALIVLAAVFSLLRPDTFPTLANAGSILTGSAALAMIAIGVTLPLIVQQFDLSAGFMATFASLLVVGLLSFNHAPVWLAILVALVVSALVGLASGLLVAYAKLNSLVVTLAAGSLLFGASEIYSGGATIYQNVPKAFLAVGQSRVAGIPLPFIYVIIVALIAWYILEYRPLGRYMYAIGGGEEGARLVGIKVDRLIVLVFVASAVMAGLGGVVQSSRVGSANPSVLQTHAAAGLHRGLSRRDLDPAGAVQHLGHRDRRLSGRSRHDRPLHARRVLLHRAGFRRRGAARGDRARQAQRAPSGALVKSTPDR